MTLEHHRHMHKYVKNQKLHDYLHTKSYVRNLDKMVLFVGILSPVMTIPQVWQIWTSKKVEGLNLLTWLAWLVFTLFWLAYGLAHKDKAITWNNFLWLLIHVFVIAGIIVYS